MASRKRQSVVEMDMLDRIINLESAVVALLANTVHVVDEDTEPGPAPAIPGNCQVKASDFRIGCHVGYKPNKDLDILWAGRVCPRPDGAQAIAKCGPLVYVLVNHPKAGWCTRGVYPWNLSKTGLR